MHDMQVITDGSMVWSILGASPFRIYMHNRRPQRHFCQAHRIVGSARAHARGCGNNGGLCALMTCKIAFNWHDEVGSLHRRSATIHLFCLCARRVAFRQRTFFLAFLLPSNMWTSSRGRAAQCNCACFHYHIRIRYFIHGHSVIGNRHAFRWRSATAHGMSCEQ